MRIGSTKTAANPQAAPGKRQGAPATGAPAASKTPARSTDGFVQSSVDGARKTKKSAAAAQTTASDPLIGAHPAKEIHPGSATASEAAFLPLVRQRHFDASAEFPNFFLMSGGKVVAPEKATAAQVRESRKQIEAALGSIFERLTLPLVLDGKLQMARFFDVVQREMPEGAQLLASGGVVRSAIGYLYDQIHTGMSQSPPIAPEETLRAIARDDSDLSGLLVKGVGSDWDMLVRCKPGQLETVRERAEGITNSAMREFAPSGRAGDDLQKSLFVVSDVKPYDEQMARVMAQGGSTLDWLAFDPRAGKLIDPPGHPEVTDDLIRGLWSYLPPEDPAKLEDADDTAIRGVRPFLELPFLRLKDEEPLRGALATVQERIEAGQVPSDRALGQFEKAVRNGRYAGAHNRFHRSSPGSLEAQILELSKAAASRLNKGELPEFVDQFPVLARRGDKSELNGLPRELLLDVHDFIEKHTDGGKLYHGTPSLQSGLAILRGGLLLSSDTQGTAAFGRGGYTTKNPGTASSYARGQGVVFSLQVRNDPRLNILDWAAVEDHPAIKAIRESLPEGEDLFEVLARDHGIDLIVHEHVLVENADALRFPRTLSDLIAPYQQALADSSAPDIKRFHSLETYESLYRYTSALGGELPAPEHYARQLDFVGMLADPSLSLDDFAQVARYVVSSKRSDVPEKSARVREAAARILEQGLAAEPAATLQVAMRLAALEDVARSYGLEHDDLTQQLVDRGVRNLADARLDESNQYDAVGRLIMLGEGNTFSSGALSTLLRGYHRPSSDSVVSTAKRLAAGVRGSRGEEQRAAFERLSRVLRVAQEFDIDVGDLSPAAEALLPQVSDRALSGEQRNDVASSLRMALDWFPDLAAPLVDALAGLVTDTTVSPEQRAEAATALVHTVHGDTHAAVSGVWRGLQEAWKRAASPEVDGASAAAEYRLVRDLQRQLTDLGCSEIDAEHLVPLSLSLAMRDCDPVARLGALEDALSTARRAGIEARRDAVRYVLEQLTLKPLGNIDQVRLWRCYERFEQTAPPGPSDTVWLERYWSPSREAGLLRDVVHEDRGMPYGHAEDLPALAERVVARGSADLALDLLAELPSQDESYRDRDRASALLKGCLQALASPSGAEVRQALEAQLAKGDARHQDLAALLLAAAGADDARATKRARAFARAAHGGGDPVVADELAPFRRILVDAAGVRGLEPLDKVLKGSRR